MRDTSLAWLLLTISSGTKLSRVQLQSVINDTILLSVDPVM